MSWVPASLVYEYPPWTFPAGSEVSCLLCDSVSILKLYEASPVFDWSSVVSDGCTTGGRYM